MEHTLLYVCLGNILRSPAAEFMTNKELKRKGLNTWKAKSIGLINQASYLPLWKLMEIELRQLGYENILRRKPRVLLASDIETSSLILCMENYHVESVHSRQMGFLKEGSVSSNHSPIVTTISLFSGYGDKDIDDPYYGTDKDYRRVAKELQLCSLGVIARLEELALQNP